MNKLVFMVALVLVVGCWSVSQAQVVEMSMKCDQLQSRLLEVIKKPEAREAQKIKEALGIDILITCGRPEGTIVCFQCLDKDNALRTLQVMKKQNAEQFEFLGFGCPCGEKK
jgi:hypothetical protein